MKFPTGSLVVMLATVAGIASAQVPTTLPPAVTTDAVTNAVTVQNDREVPVTVYLSNGKIEQRLGVVPALATETLALPSSAVRPGASVRLIAHPAASFEDLSTDKFTLGPSGRVAMIVRAQFATPAIAPTDTMMQVIAPQDVDKATITIDNQRNVAVSVYAEAGPFNVRLGEVAANTRATLQFPKAALSSKNSIRLFVRPEGGLDLVSTSFTAQEGDHFGLRVLGH